MVGKHALMRALQSLSSDLTSPLLLTLYWHGPTHLRGGWEVLVPVLKGIRNALAMMNLQRPRHSLSSGFHAYPASGFLEHAHGSWGFVTLSAHPGTSQKILLGGFSVPSDAWPLLQSLPS